MICGLRLTWAGADPGKRYAAANARHATQSSEATRFIAVSYAGSPKPNKPHRRVAVCGAHERPGRDDARHAIGPDGQTDVAGGRGRGRRDPFPTSARGRRAPRWSPAVVGKRTRAAWASRPRPRPPATPAPKSPWRKGWRDHGAIADQGPGRSPPARPVEPFGLRLFRRRADEGRAGPLARGLVGLTGRERLRDVVLARDHEGGEPLREKLLLLHVELDDVSGPVPIDGVAVEPALKGRLPACTRRQGVPGAVGLGRLNADPDAVRLLKDQNRIDVAVDVLAGYGCGRCGEAERSKGARQRDVARRH